MYSSKAQLPVLGWGLFSGIFAAKRDLMFGVFKGRIQVGVSGRLASTTFVPLEL